MRRISIYFIVVFSLEILVFTGLFIWAYITVSDQLEIVKNFSTLSAAFGSLLLTSALVYHNFWQRPELRLMDIVIDPLDARLQNIAENEYKGYVFLRHRDSPGGYIRLDQTRPKMEQGFLVVKSTSQSSKIRVSTDVCNVGVSETTIHEYTIKETKPTSRHVGTYTCRERPCHTKKG